LPEKLPDNEQTNAQKSNGADILLAVAEEQGLMGQAAIMTAERSVTYGELAEKACQYGHALRSLGVGRQDRVLLVIEDRPEMFFAYLGAMKIGAVPVALNLRLSDSELGFIIEDSACKIIISEEDYIGVCLAACENVDASPVVMEMGTSSGRVVSLDDLANGQPKELESVQLGPEDMALWMYTSGTTGTSKGAVHQIKSLDRVGRYLGPVYGAQPGDKVFCSSKLFFAFSLGHSLLATLRLGATAILHAGWPSAEAIASVINEFRPNLVFSVPTMYRNLLADGSAEGDGFKAVRHYISAGEHLPERVYREWQAVTGHPIHGGIGATETLMMFIANRPDSTYPDSTGTPLPETEIRLVSDDGIEIIEPGLPGVVWVKSDSLAAGYWNQSDNTAAVFKDGWYRTGDVFIKNLDGYYFYQARDDDMLKISGQWVSPTEVDEYVLQLPDVFEAATIGIENEKGLVRLALCLVTEDPGVDRDALQTKIIDHLTENLSVYKCPRRFVYLDEMPKTTTGKIQRFKLRLFARDQIGGRQ
jgi:benzoate-CoA ligase family protein